MNNSKIICFNCLLMLLPGPLAAQSTGKLTDSRDGKEYSTITIGNQRWMAENLNYGTRISGSTNQSNDGKVEKYCYDNLESNCKTGGALYQWNEMMNYTSYPVNQGICPVGWHVPSDDEWKELEIYLGMSEADADLTGFRGTDQGTQLKSGGTSGFNATLDGYMTSPDNYLRGGEGNCFWTATDIYARYLLESRTEVHRWDTPSKTYGLSLRCMMDYPFTATSSGLPQVRSSITKWCDYDNDGDMDLFLCGITTYPNGVSDIYRNNGNGTFTALGTTIEKVSGSADWGDYDCDGDADLLISGYYTSDYITRLYRNDGSGVFTNYSIDIPGGFLVKWGDYDNDGDPDILINQGDDDIEIFENKGTGTYQHTGIYFEKVYTEFISLNLSSFDWGDYNNDGFPDVVVTGKDYIGNKYCKIYKNNGNKTFTDLDLVLRGAPSGRVNWGDFDNDNDLDILLTGHYFSIQIYKNEGNDVFSYFDADLVDYQALNVWFDFNNDGNLDILLAGYNDSRIYSGNGKGSFEYMPCPIANASSSDIDIADYDNDGDLDFVYSGFSLSNSYTQLYRNNTVVVNQTPQAPTGLTARQVGADVVFSWNPASDSENGENLSYNITAGTSSGNCLIISPLSNLSNGKRLKLNRGNVGSDTTWILKNAPVGLLYWSVQSIDRTLKSSAFATFRSFEVKPPFSGITINAQLSDEMVVSGNSFIDINNDGLLDILTSCSNTSLMMPTQEVFCFINQGNNIFSSGTVTGSKLVGKFIPCNLNGDAYMDALLCGNDYVPTGVGHAYEAVPKVYSLINNKSDGFNVSTGDFANIKSKAVTTGDFDNDGDDDIFLIDYKTDTMRTYLFNKENTGYSVIDLGYQFERHDQAISAFDIDNDQDIDIVYGKHILLNDSVFIKIDIFPYENVISMDWGDFDGDGDLDAALVGQDTIDNFICRIHENQGNLTFSTLKTKIRTYSYKGFIRWLDYDNDGLLDLAVSGSAAGSDLMIYINQGNSTFIESDFPGYNVFDWGDFDDDGDMDFLDDKMVYISSGDWNNHPPQAPTNLISILDEFDVFLSWDRAADLESSDGLTYNLRVGTSRDSCNVMQVLTAADGQLRVPRMGNVQTNNSWYLKDMPLGRYYWSVQAVDNTYKGGPWTEESSFELGNVFVDFEFDTICFGKPTTFTDRSTSREGEILSWYWDFGDGGISHEQHPQYYFAQHGEKDVKLTIGLATGSYHKTKKVIIKPKPGVLFIFEPVSEGGEIMTFENQTDTFGISIAEWKWDFGDDNVFMGRDPPQHGYLSTGTYTVQLSVTGSNGCSDSISKNIQVCHGILQKPELLAYGPNTWYLVCSNDTAPYYRWYRNGDQLFNQSSYILVTDKEMGEYQVAVSSDDECYVSSDIVSIPITGVSAIEKDEFIRIYPNPNDGYFTVHIMNEFTGRYSYRLTDMLGKEIISGMIKIEDEKAILFKYDYMTDGIYIIEIYNDRTRVYSGKIVIKKQ